MTIVLLGYASANPTYNFNLDNALAGFNAALIRETAIAIGSRMDLQGSQKANCQPTHWFRNCRNPLNTPTARRLSEIDLELTRYSTKQQLFALAM